MKRSYIVSILVILIIIFASLLLLQNRSITKSTSPVTPKLEQKVQPATRTRFEPVASVDGKWLIFFSLQDMLAQPTLMLKNLSTGNEKQMLQVEPDERSGFLSASMSPDSSKVIMAAYRDYPATKDSNAWSSVDIYSYNVNTEKLIKLSPESWMTGDLISPHDVKFLEWKNQNTVSMKLIYSGTTDDTGVDLQVP